MEMTFRSCMIGCSALREQRSLYAPPLLAKRPLHLRRETQNSAPLRFSEDETRVIRLGPTVRSIPNCVSRTLVASTARGSFRALTIVVVEQTIRPCEMSSRWP